MRLFLLAATSACAVLLAQPLPSALAQPSKQSTNPTNLYSEPVLDGTTLAFAYDRLTGITPDFRPYAERSMSTRNANAFDREAVLARETARFQAAFQSLDLLRVYVVRLRTELNQYTTVRGGYALALSEDSFIRMVDSATSKEYGLKLRNSDEVNFIPVGDATAARAFADRTRLNTQGSVASTVVLQMAIRLADAPPALDTGAPPMVNADVLSAQVLRENGPVIYDFGITATARQIVAGTSAASAGPTMLKAADVQGMRLGMSQAEAEAVASRGWTTKRGSQQVGQVLWFNDLQARQDDWAVCGDIRNGVPPPMDLMVGASPPSYKDCIGYGFARLGASNGPFGDRIGQVAAQQFLSGGDATTLRKALEDKYGKPTIVRGGGSDLAWVGHDPAKPDGDMIKIEAKLGKEDGSSAQNRVVFQILMEPYVDPRRPQAVAAQPAVTGGPRL